MIIEDDPAILKTVTRMLEKLGHEVVACTDGLKAVERFKTEDCWKLILSDIRMPGQDGLETLRQIREMERELGMTPTPVIVMTGYADESAPIKALKLGVRDYFLKPFDTSKFIHSIQLYSQNCN